MWLNEYEVEDSVRRAINADMPNTETAARRLRNLMDYVNANSDGWPYWRKPQAASKKLSTAIHLRLWAGWDKRIKEDMTPEELKAALTPIKAFLTREGADWKEIFARDY